MIKRTHNLITGECSEEFIKLIDSIDAYHDDYVADAVDLLQNDGFKITKIERKEKMFLGIFGRDLTYIWYK